MSDIIPKPNKQVAAKIEELLQEQLFERGVNPKSLSPKEISEGMYCTIAPDNSLTYYWLGNPILYVTPEAIESDTGHSVLWRMFTKDDDLLTTTTEEINGHS